jgi:hypothetical protein
MLENLAPENRLAPFSPTGCRSCAAFSSAGQRGPLVFPRRVTGTLFSAIKRITKHSGDGFVSAQKMHLETVRLFLRPRFRVDATNVWF